jgi:hypothetical protein
MTLLAKDTALAVQAACQLGAPHRGDADAEAGANGPVPSPDCVSDAAAYRGPLGQYAAEVFAQALAAGLASQDDCALFKLLQTPGVGK